MSSDSGVLRLLNPLNIRFSQPRIAPHFRDGHLLVDTAAEVRSEPLQDAPAYESTRDAAEGRPPYDLVLLPPFPAIRVISWLPKLRGADGEVERDGNGDQILGKRAWFALDNRRLWSLQDAAAKAWPKRCCAIVRCLEDVPGTTIRELRKFRTTTEGRSINLGVHSTDTTPWSWLEAAPPGARIDEESIEGLYSEDLWDALQWAPRHGIATSERDPEDFVPKSSSGSHRKQERAKEEQVASSNGTATAIVGDRGQIGRGNTTAPNGGSPTSMMPQAIPFQPGQTLLKAANAASGGSRRGEASACPEMGWEYVDPAGRTQGPFDRRKMRLWHEHNYFYPDLMMRCSKEDAFVPFSVLFPPPVEPFLGPVRRFKLQ